MLVYKSYSDNISLGRVQHPTVFIGFTGEHEEVQRAVAILRKLLVHGEAPSMGGVVAALYKGDGNLETAAQVEGVKGLEAEVSRLHETAKKFMLKSEQQERFVETARYKAADAERRLAEREEAHLAEVAALEARVDLLTRKLRVFVPTL